MISGCRIAAGTGASRGPFSSPVAIVIEVLSPHDETWEKQEFYAVHGVDEILIVAPAEHSATWLVLRDGRYVESGRSALLGADSRGLADRITWPAVDQPA
jgi:Uma2 family endonuclease